MRLFHDSIWLILGRCGFAAALPPFGPSLLSVSALTRGSRYREFGDWPNVPAEFQTKKNPSTDTWGDKAGSRGVGHAKQFGDAFNQRPLGSGL